MSLPYPPPAILMYHRICRPPPTAKIKGMYVDPRQFDWQIRWLKKQGYEFTSFSALAERPAHSRSIMLTLDDGYLDSYTNAFPILQRHRVTAVVYPILEDLGKSGVTWPGATEQSPADMLNRNQVAEMAQAGIEFGSHLLHHKRLSEMSREERQRELTCSKSELEALTGQPVLSIAYPYGDHDDTVVAETAAAGYRFAVTTLPGINARNSNPLRLVRLTAKGCKLHHPVKFRRMLRQAKRNTDVMWPV